MENQPGGIPMNKPSSSLLQLSEPCLLSNDKTEIKAKIETKEPSLLSVFFLILVILSLYSFSFYQLSKAVNNFVDTVVEKVEKK